MDARISAGGEGRVRGCLPGRPPPVKPAICDFFSSESPGTQPLRLQHKESIGRRGNSQPDSPADPGNRKTESFGDTCGMGHCDSSARLSGAGGVFPAQPGAAGAAAGVSGVKRSPAARALLFLIRVYQSSLSPWMAAPCKFYPTCSRYAYEAIEVHGARRGAWLALRRLSRCRPFSQGGVDFVPKADNDPACSHPVQEHAP